jgi:Na+-transporting NADH:ubiquinone oxidoreductase subunit NqrD
MRHFASRFAVLSIFVGLVVLAGQVGGRAEGAHSFIVAANDGYGVQDCLGEGGECGRVVADAWCEAHGHGAALAYQPVDEVALA